MPQHIGAELLKQANQSAIDFSVRALSSLFLLNGAAATALLAQASKSELILPALIFAFAALWAVISLGLAYIHCWLLSEFFLFGKLEVPLSEAKRRLILLWKFPPTFTINEFIKWRIRLIIFSLGPAVLFLFGLVVTGVCL